MPDRVMPASQEPVRSTPTGVQTPATAPHGPVLQSNDLLQGRHAIVIEHNGSVYRLQTTRQGKLILTK